ncbi:MAG: PQQ-binding-like beta-propeller repeat protein, partial [Planctomycetota bacterium]
ATEAATGEVVWKSGLTTESVYFRLTRAEQELTLNDRGRGAVTGLRNLHEQLAYRDAASGSLSADERHIYAIQNVDLPKLIVEPGFNQRFPGGFDHRRRLRTNRLIAYDRVTGRTAWSVGGSTFRYDTLGNEDPTAGSFFCGPPLPTEHGLATLAETGGSLRLLVLDPADGAVRRVIPIATPPTLLFEPPWYRLAGLGIAEAAGLWIVPTSAGGVAAIDPLSGSFVWTYRYLPSVETEDGLPVVRRAPLGTSEDDQPKWADAPPKIVGDRVLLTPRDSGELHCLDVKTGELQWRRRRGPSRQLAAVWLGTPDDGGDGEEQSEDDAWAAALVGDDGVRGIRLSDGAVRWFTPLPPARGDATPAGDVLIVPLADDTFASLRLSDGAVLNRLPAGGAVGNLIAAGGRLVSQSPRGVSAFSTRSEIAQDLAAAFLDQDDTASLGPALLLRADAALQDGRPADAVADLIAAATPGSAAASNVETRLAASRARDRLSAVFSDGLRRDFEAFAPLLPDAQSVLGDPPGGEVARAYAAGLTEAGRTVDAFRVIAGARDDGGRPAVSASSWARPRLARLFLEANDADRGPMIAIVADAYADADDDRTALEAFARHFGRLCGLNAWRAATPMPDGAVDLADSALRRAADLAEAEQRTAPIVAARLLRWAASRPGAAPVTEELASLRQSVGADLAVRRLRGEPLPDPANGRRIAASEADDRGRLPRQTRLPVNVLPDGAAGGQLIASDANPDLRWQDEDGRLAMLHTVLGSPARRGPKGLWEGPLLVAGLGDRVIALETLTKDEKPNVLWRLNIPQSSTPGLPFSLTPDLEAPNARGTELNGPVALSPRQVVIRVGSSLVARDPISGEPLWRRDGLPAQTRIVGNDSVLLILAPQGDRAALLSADDGSDLALISLPPAADRWMERGSRVWSRSVMRGRGGRSTDQTTIACIDAAPRSDENSLTPAPPRTVWERTFPPGSVFAPNDAATHLIAVTPDRVALVVDLQTGEEVIACELGDGPEVVSIWGERSPTGWTIAVSDEPERIGGRPIQLFGSRNRGGPAASSTIAYGIRADELIWSRSVVSLPGAIWQPPGLPVLAVTGRAPLEEGQSRYRRPFVISLIDTRNGAEIGRTESLTSLTPAHWEIPKIGPWSEDEDGRKPIRLLTRGADLELRLLDEPLEEPVRGAESEAPDPPGGDS